MTEAPHVDDNEGSKQKSPRKAACEFLGTTSCYDLSACDEDMICYDQDTLC